MKTEDRSKVYSSSRWRAALKDADSMVIMKVPLEIRPFPLPKEIIERRHDVAGVMSVCRNSLSLRVLYPRLYRVPSFLLIFQPMS